MTRTKAREIALGCIFECLFRDAPADEVLFARLCEPGISGFAGEDELYSGNPEDADADYIKRVVTLAAENADGLFSRIAELSVGWSGERISAMSRAILTLSMTEILYLDDVPDSASINEAVELAKKYDVEKAPAFINGILGRFIRQEKPGTAENIPELGSEPAPGPEDAPGETPETM